MIELFARTDFELKEMDVKDFIAKLGEEPFDANLLKSYGLSNGELVERLREVYDF